MATVTHDDMDLCPACAVIIAYGDESSDDYDTSRPPRAVCVSTMLDRLAGHPVVSPVEGYRHITCVGCGDEYEGESMTLVVLDGDTRKAAPSTDGHDAVTCGECGAVWCDRCTPTHGPRCPFEYDHDTDTDDD